MLTLISKPVFDDFHYSLFCKLVQTVDYPAYYCYSATREAEAFFRNAKFSSPIVIVGLKDMLDLSASQGPNSTHPFLTMVQKYPGTQFILFTSMQNLILPQSNVHVISWGPDWLNQDHRYQILQPVDNKNFESDKIFICLNRNGKSHRLVSLSYLCGGGYDKFGQMTYLCQHPDNPIRDNFLTSTFPWHIFNWRIDSPRQDQIRDQILNGYDGVVKIMQDPAADNFQVLGPTGIDPVTNFKTLRLRYHNSFVEIVNETMYDTTEFMLTEKTIQSVYGYNFPIILSGVGIVQHLRDLGLDMFDDIIDHSYDRIENLLDRIVTAIDSNRQLLTDAEYTKEKWKQCQHRFESNVKIIKNVPYYFESSARQQFEEVVQNVCKIVSDTVK
jgi:hypothetical protein